MTSPHQIYKRNKMNSGTSNSPTKVSRSSVHKLKKSINSYLFPTSHKNLPLPIDDTEQESKIDQLRTYLEELGHPLDTSQIEKLLELNAWNVREVAEYCSDLGEAEEGIIVDIQKDIVMLGCENDRMTSCYIGMLRKAFTIYFVLN
jgi:hypothetical protein